MKISNKYFYLLGLLLLVFQVSIFAQIDSTKSKNITYITQDAKMSIADGGGVSMGENYTSKVPSTAALYSAVLPGLGQAYNGKYWKMPIVYLAMGASIYAVVWNQQNYDIFLEAYRIRKNGGIDDYYNILKDEKQLISWMDYYRNQRDMSILITLGLYAFNILDAYVDAHLSNFNINDNLSMRIQPAVIPSYVAGNYYSYGLSLKLDIK